MYEDINLNFESGCVRDLIYILLVLVAVMFVREALNYFLKTNRILSELEFIKRKLA